MIIYYSLTGQGAFQATRGFWEATSDLKWREAPNGVTEAIYDSCVTGYGETQREAVDSLIEKLQSMGLKGRLRKIK